MWFVLCRVLDACCCVALVARLTNDSIKYVSVPARLDCMPSPPPLAVPLRVSQPQEREHPRRQCGRTAGGMRPRTCTARCCCSSSCLTPPPPPALHLSIVLVQYEEKIASYGGIELFLGGIGPDGHIAFNEPGSSLTSRTRVKTLVRAPLTPAVVVGLLHACVIDWTVDVAGARHHRRKLAVFQQRPVPRAQVRLDCRCVIAFPKSFPRRLRVSRPRRCFC